MKILTIAIPAYNVEKYLDRCLFTLVFHDQINEVEIIIVNDGSIDNTLAISKKYQKDYPDLIFIINKVNGGHGSTINAAIAHAHGLYFMIVDGDDWVDSESLAKLVRTLGDINVDLVSTNYYRVDMNSGESEAVCQKGIIYNKVLSFENLNIDNIYFALASSVFKTEILKRHNILLQENTYYVDVEYMLMPIPYVKTVLFLDLYVYRYFVGNTQQSIYIPTLVKRYSHHDRVLKRVIIYMNNKQSQLTQTHKDYINNILLQLINTHYSISLNYNENKSDGLKKAQEFDDFLKTQSPELYTLSNKKIYYLRIYRKYNFNYKRVHYSLSYRLRNSFVFTLMKKVYYKLKLLKKIRKY